MTTAQDPIAATSDRREICCSMTSVLLRTVRALKGEAGVWELLERSGCDRDSEFLENTDNWISLDEANALLQAGVTVTGDEQLARRVGADAVRQHAGTQVATMLRSLGSPEAVLGGITAAAAKFSTVTDMEALETEPGRAVVRAKARESFKRSRLLCDWTTGLLSTPCMLFGLPPARVEEVECQARGGAECRYIISWDEELAAAARDPEQRVTALEAQVVALARRLESAYATASDLVSPDDLDSVLARIVERAASAVRAPGFVLAVRPEPNGELRVFSEGVSAAEATRIASAAVDPDGSDEQMLCVDVASSRREYGRLVAMHPAGMRFFPQEGQLLALYAKHAAAVLDTALALEEASRRHRNVSALLALSQALAQAGTTQEIVARLSEAVTGVIDCDQAGVWTWDERENCLRRECTGPSAGAAPEQLSPRDTPHLRRMLTAPQPMFFANVTDDPVLQSIMTDARLVALAVVPIIAREIFLGLLTVGVEERAERLARTPELLEKLGGIAALAAPALQNGRLIDELGRQVMQDGLTGVLNRRGFGQLIENVLTEVVGGEGCAGLLFVDLDGFKALNDEHGHQFGDAVLCEVAERLRRSFRNDDTVARLGGDEFAVILPRVSSERDLDAAAERVESAFARPFPVGEETVTLSACVGQALAPDHGSTIDALVRHADAAMYQLKAQAKPTAGPESSLAAQPS